MSKNAVICLVNIKYTLHLASVMADNIVSYSDIRVRKYCIMTYEAGSKYIKFNMPYEGSLTRIMLLQMPS